MRILELGQLVPGPYCGQVFAGSGAHVVKVEVPASRHDVRMGVRFDGRSLLWSVIARGKDG
ncbi:CoA transferase [Kineobactrum salinum]|uniref:CoA transferase n=1 Tax=Kineobactrum salinum TaxID=2708301 RepID=UPI0018D9F98C